MGRPWRTEPNYSIAGTSPDVSGDAAETTDYFGKQQQLLNDL
jgi:hypothetical protein